MTGIHELARGHWLEILPALGVGSEYMSPKHRPCPLCGGKDRYRWTNYNGDGCYYCSQCGPGDGFALVQAVTGMAFVEMAKQICKMLGHSNEYIVKSVDGEEVAQAKKMKSVWEGSGSPKLGGPTATYLESRVGCLWPSNAIREAFYGGRTYMVCQIVDSEGRKAVNLHLTALTQDGKKDNTTITKRVMKGKLPDGCAIRLGPTKSVMGVAEGIETAISAAIMFDMPVWACVNATLLSKWIPPAKAEHVTVFSDNDANFTGQAKAYHLANRLEVQFKRKATVMVPPVVGDDWNDHHHKTWGKNTTSFLRVVK